MKSLLVLLLLFSFSAQAVVIEVYGACSSKPVYSGELAPKFESVADLTFHFLKKNKIPFEGTNKGVQNMLNYPTGLDANEILSDTDMRSYGWCFFVDGKNPDVYADEIPLDNVKKIEWVYSYAFYSKGTWKSMCVRAYKIRPDFICK